MGDSEPPPDLASMRRMLRARRASPGLAAAANAGALQACMSTSQPISHAGAVNNRTDDAVQPPHADATGPSTEEHLQSLITKGHEAVQLGDHSNALQHFTDALAISHSLAAPATNAQSDASGNLASTRQSTCGCTAGAQADLTLPGSHGACKAATTARKEGVMVRHSDMDIGQARQESSSCSEQACSAVMAELHLHCAACHAQLGEHRAAVAACDGALQLASDSVSASDAVMRALRAKALVQRGFAEEVLERFEDSKRDFSAALSLDPSNKMVGDLSKCCLSDVVVLDVLLPVADLVQIQPP